jgi:hypothetical protein
MVIGLAFSPKVALKSSQELSLFVDKICCVIHFGTLCELDR